MLKFKKLNDLKKMAQAIFYPHNLTVILSLSTTVKQTLRKKKVAYTFFCRKIVMFEPERRE